MSSISKGKESKLQNQLEKLEQVQQMKKEEKKLKR